ncbi:ATP-dependent Clp protease ATP-binding subunit ClpC [Micromonospora sp. Llam0]|uniref:Clp protease N-terminal domain-containing protein n=1 Tax=Micromonospora sp. Llam0 TaxID=2485143 RepID=UPI000F47D5AB|nr:Clp protease N-terminal domain-containing protein [Micromonospora sp. Llam0]ROO60283.1 ATP-dependent Clp protease ATP-binding subunit ClpC [Micromonospora sp. Llam0]
MPKINVYLPDELAEAVKEAGVPVSAICQRALEQAVRRVTAIRETTLGDLDDADLAAKLPHFTARTRAALKLGIEQAAEAPAVGSGHLLGGLLTEGGNLALHVLRAVEIEPDRVGRELARQPLTEAGVAAEDAARRFSGPASNALELAVTEATAFGHNYVGCEHLLLGLIAEPDGTAGQVLRSLGAELRLTRRAVAAALAGYVHLRAQTPQAAASGTTETAAALAAVVRQELQPIVQRIERLEERAGVVTES